MFLHLETYIVLEPPILYLCSSQDAMSCFFSSTNHKHRTGFYHPHCTEVKNLKKNLRGNCSVEKLSNRDELFVLQKKKVT